MSGSTNKIVVKALIGIISLSSILHASNPQEGQEGSPSQGQKGRKVFFSRPGALNIPAAGTGDHLASLQPNPKYGGIGVPPALPVDVKPQRSGSVSSEKEGSSSTTTSMSSTAATTGLGATPAPTAPSRGHSSSRSAKPATDPLAVLLPTKKRLHQRPLLHKR